MKKKALLATAIAAAVSTGFIATGVTGVLAATEKTQETPAKTAEKDLVKVSNDAMMVMRSLRDARFAIFDGQPAEARKNVDAAVTEIANTVRDADKFAVDTKTPTRKDDAYVPYDAALTVADTFILTEENKKNVAKANEHLHKGQKKEALEALKLGNVDVAFTTWLIPVKFAQHHINDAAKLIADGKYYEANLALKAVDDSVVTELIGVDETPKPKH
jgi:YfdX protein